MNFFSQDDDTPQPAPSLSLPALSLMSPDATAPDMPATTAWESDLGVAEVVDALALSRKYRGYVRGVLTGLATDARVIAWRQSVLADFVDNPALVEQIEALLPRLANLGEESALLGKQRRSLLMETTDRLSELELYVDLLADLHALLDGIPLQSEALRALRQNLADVLDTPTYADLKQKLPALREPLQNIGSITVGINLDYELKPTSAVLLSINHRSEGRPRSLLSRLFSEEEDDYNELRGLRKPHRFPRDSELRRYDELFQDVNALMHETAQPVANALKRYTRTSSAALVALEPELAFFAGAARLDATAALARGGHLPAGAAAGGRANHAHQRAGELAVGARRRRSGSKRCAVQRR